MPEDRTVSTTAGSTISRTEEKPAEKAVAKAVVCGSCRHMSFDHGKDGACEGVGCWCTKFWPEHPDGPEEGAGGHLSERASV